MQERPFLSLAMDLPPPPLYLDERLQNIIPQVPLAQLFTKFNGCTEKVSFDYTFFLICRCKILNCSFFN